ncbi:MAG: DUF4956 domain-containing protein [Gemmatimonadetes bacterium]|nr:DUF4956 domain-containing protein [Gemmatimonadota bacterium]MYK52028.1 DUF4956 domain-containing protein [Gemmatimonadota bacterium]
MLNNIIIRLAIYYITWLLILNAIFHIFPEILYYVAQERERIFVGSSLDSGADPPIPLGNIQEGVNRLADPEHTIPVVVALVLAFGVTLPITWVYAWTHPPKKYSQAFVQTLLVIPVAISLVVFLVKGSLALAFSLAGIVAAVTFRLSLKSTIEGVYMFMVIGIGLAAGTQLTTVAYLASLAFVTITLGVWKINYGAQPPVLSGWRIVSPDHSVQTSGTKATGNSYDARIEVHTTKVETAQKATAQILKSGTKQWQVADVIEKEDGTAIVVYDVSLKQSVDLPSLIQDIEKSKKSITNATLTKV